MIYITCWKKTKRGYTSKRKYINGYGFVDSLSSAFNSIKPTFQNIGSYIAQNKDLIAKPLLGAAGDLAAFGLTEAGKAVITKLVNKKEEPQDEKNTEILQNLLGVSNIIGSGIKSFQIYLFIYINIRDGHIKYS